MVKFLDKLNLSSSSTRLQNLILFILLLILGQTTEHERTTCSDTNKLKDNDGCFTNMIYLYGRSGQFHLRNDGVLLIEFSSGGQRIFFGLKPNGRGAFENDSPIYLLERITVAYNSNNNPIDGRYESKNCLVSLENDLDKKKQYLFSVSEYHSLAELHYFDEEFKNSHKTWTTTDFFNLAETRYIFSYQFALIEAPSNIYYAAYVQYEGTDKINGENQEYSVSYTLSKFKFTSATERNIIKSLEFGDNFDNRIVSAFIFEKYNYLAVVFLRDPDRLGSNTIAYYLRFHDLNSLEKKYEIELYNIGSDKEIGDKGNGLYFKALYLKDEYFAFIFFASKNEMKLRFKIYFVGKDNNDINFNQKNGEDFGYENLNTKVKLHEFYKIDDESLLIVTSLNTNKKLFFIFID